MLDRVLAERYEIKEQLGRNTGRRTFLARDLQTGELVVLKLLAFDIDFDWQDLKLFEREAEILKSLSHPAIPRYLNSFNLDLPHLKCFAVVQSYIAGKSLDKYLKDGRVFAEAEVRQLAEALLEILIYLHGCQPPVIHRDIKPSNVLLTNRSANSVGDVYLVDFGSVQTLATRDKGSFTVAGTYGYMPPEQFGGRTLPASDLYGLGATLIYLVTGTHPADLPQKDFKIEFESAAKNSSSELVSWLRSMTEPSIDKRLSSARSALQELRSPRRSIERSSNISSEIVGQLTKGRVALNKEIDSLEVIISNNSSLYLGNTIAQISIAALLIAFILLTAAPPTSYVLAISVLALVVVGLTLSKNTPKTVLSIDRSEISLINYSQSALEFILGRPLKKTTIADSRQNITRICLFNYPTSDYSPTPTQGVLIETKQNIFSFPTLTSDEKTLIVNELSAWLKLPIEFRT